ncbi:MAG: hypothetical protein ACR2QB_09835 [Gammaproteobacteria bacterium]
MKTLSTKLLSTLLAHALAAAMLATLFLGFFGVALAGEPFSLQTHKTEVYGTRDLESGDYDQAISKLERWHRWARNSQLLRGPVLINLCVAYTAKREFAAAEEFCDAAVENGRSLAVAYNNRGVMNAARGDYLAAVMDFESARNRGGQRIARDNLLLAQTRLRSTSDGAMLASIDPGPAQQ